MSLQKYYTTKSRRHDQEKINPQEYQTSLEYKYHQNLMHLDDDLNIKNRQVYLTAPKKSVFKNQKMINSFLKQDILKQSVESPKFNFCIQQCQNEKGQTLANQQSNFQQKLQRSIVSFRDSIGQNKSFNQIHKNYKYNQVQITSLLIDCKLSIVSLQNQVKQKNKRINQLQGKWLQSEKQVQRTHEMLGIYMKQSQQSILNEKQDKKVENYSDILIKYQKQVSELEKAIYQSEKISNFYINQNSELKQSNHKVKQRYQRLKQENVRLNQKIITMGQGVGKALSTIKKNNNSQLHLSKTQSKHSITKSVQKTCLIKSQQKSNKMYGKIMTHPIKSQLQSHSAAVYQTPQKYYFATSNLSSIDSLASSQQILRSTAKQYQQKLQFLSKQLKMTQRVDKMQQVVKRMQLLANQDGDELIQACLRVN